MRILFVVIAIGLATAAAPAGAYENFIPLGHNYSPDDPSMPDFNSEQDKFNAQVDIYETEIYTRQLFQKQNNTYLRRFLNSQQGNGGTMTYLDY